MVAPEMLDLQSFVGLKFKPQKLQPVIVYRLAHLQISIDSRRQVYLSRTSCSLFPKPITTRNLTAPRLELSYAANRQAELIAVQYQYYRQG